MSASAAVPLHTYSPSALPRCKECGATLTRPDGKYCGNHRYLALQQARTPTYQPTDLIDGVIREAYKRYLDNNDRRAIGRAALKIRWPKHQVHRRAARLGLVQVKEPRWSEAEEQLLRRWGHLTDGTVCRKLHESGFDRSVNAVHLKMARLRVKQNLEGYSANSLAAAFGRDRHVIARWIERKWLTAERRGTERVSAQGGDSYWIKREDVKAFIFRYPDEVDLRKVEKWWFLDLLTDGRICR